MHTLYEPSLLRSVMCSGVMAWSGCKGRCDAARAGAVWTQPAAPPVWRQPGRPCVTVVADREGDVCEEFALRPAEVELVIRAQQDRTLADGTLLSRCLDGVAALGCETISLPAGPGRRARTARLALRVCPVRLKAPKRVSGGVRAGTLPAEAALWFVEAREVAPPDNAPAAHWLLLTAHAVPDLGAARLITRLCRQRWTTEQLLWTMRTRSFDIEAAQVEADGPLANLAAAVLIAAIQVLQPGAAARCCRWCVSATGLANARSAMRSTWPTSPAWPQSARAWQARPSASRTRTRHTPWPGQRGSVPAWAAGTATMTSQGPSRSIADCSNCGPCSTAGT